MNTEVDVALAGESDRRLIDGLAQFHIYDFSEFDPAESDDFEPRADGRFEPIPHFDSYWREDSRLALLIRRGDRPVGFALIDAVTHGGPPVDRGMAEFFVLRKHRRAGVASAAVRAILTRWLGRWEVAVGERNAGARAFWPVAVAAAPGVRDLTTLEGDGVHWTGPILRFTVEA